MCVYVAAKIDVGERLTLASLGFNEPNALAVIGRWFEMLISERNERAHRNVANDGSGDNHIFHLYVREKDPKAELWDGARSGTRAAVDVFNADEVSYICHLLFPKYN